MTDPSGPVDRPIRVLVVARQPIEIEDLGLDQLDDVAAVQLIRRPRDLDAAIAEVEPTVVLVDTGYPEDGGPAAISHTDAEAPDARVLALTPSPPPHREVALAVRAGAIGIVDLESGPSEIAAAVRSAHRGDSWLPPEEVLGVLGAVAEDLDVTAAERRGRLTGIVVGLIPLTGALAALMSLMWRKYLGHVGVRPVDLAIDPTTRVIDALETLSGLIGVVGPLLFVGSWLDLVASRADEHGRVARLLRQQRGLVQLVVSLAVLVIGAFLVIYVDLVVIVFVGPLVLIAVLARALDLDDSLPAVLRITRLQPRRAVTGGLVAIVLFLAVVSFEVLLVGPDFRTDGVHGLFAPRLLGFRAQPVLAYDVDDARPPREVLYLGGNADLYVFVYPCDDDLVEYVSVGSSRLEVIDEITCDPPDG